MPFSTPTPTPTPTRQTLQFGTPSPSPSYNSIVDAYSDQRTHGYQGPSRSVTLPSACSVGSSAVCKSQDGTRCVVAGRECTCTSFISFAYARGTHPRIALRVLRMTEGSDKHSSDHKFAIGKGGHRIDASHNLWTGSGLKVDSAPTDVAWCRNGAWPWVFLE